MNEFEFADKYLGEYKFKNGEINAKYCYFCGGGKSGEKYKFFLNPEKHTYICHRGSCHARGTFKELCDLENERADYVMEYKKNYFENSNKNKKNYELPKMELKSVSEKAHTYIKLRQISDNTIKAFNISSDIKGNIVFPYYDENNTHVLNKIRIPKKFIKGVDKGTKIWQEGGGKPVLFNMNNIDIDKPVVITEGEWDCLSVYESGYKNVVSIPFGTGNLDWINECWDWLEKIDEFILWWDNDEAGKKGIEEVSKKLGIYRCKIVFNDNTKLKDANSILYKEGKNKVLELIENADYIPVENFNRLADCVKVKTERMLYGLRELDYELGGCRMGELVIWTGKRGGGKSTVLSQTIPEAVEQGYKVFIYSGELSNSKVKEWLDRQIAGENNIVIYKDELTQREEYGVNPNIEPYINEWYKDYIYAYGDDGENNEDCLFEIMEYAYKRHDIKRFILDNLKTIRFSGQNEENFYRLQGMFVNRCKSFARQYNVHIDLVVHPKKTGKEFLDDEDVGGSSDIIDLADNIISVSRLTENMYEKASKKEKEKMRHKDHPGEQYDEYVKNSILEVKKNREYGDTNRKIYYFFEPKTKRIFKNFNREPFKFLKNKSINNLKEECEPDWDTCPF